MRRVRIMPLDPGLPGLGPRGAPRVVFSLRIGDDEIAGIVAAARRRGVTISEYIRQSALDAARKENAQSTGSTEPGLHDLRQQVNVLLDLLSRMEESPGEAQD